MCALIKCREKDYSGSSIRLALSRERSVLKVWFGRIDFLTKSDVASSDHVYDYGDLILLQIRQTTAKTLEILRSQSLIIDKTGTIEFRGTVGGGGMPVNVPSGKNSGYIKPSWPSAYYYFMLDANIRGSLPQHQLVRLGLPLYPDAASAVASFLGLSTGYVDCRMVVLIPDFRARIRSLRIQGQKVVLDVETLASTEQSLRSKFYCQSEDGQSYYSDDLEIKHSTSEFMAPKEPTLVLAHVLSADGDDVDHRDFFLYGENDPSIVVEAGKARIEELIRRGEGQRIEFKGDLPSNPNDLLESITAFANTFGGTILLGIGNNGEIEGIKRDLDTVQETITNWIAQKCDPRINVRMSKSNLEGRALLVVDVPVGADRPYVLLDRGVFMRTGATDRHVRRSELDNLYKQPQSPR
jgi:hypothetical protein